MSHPDEAIVPTSQTRASRRALLRSASGALALGGGLLLACSGPPPTTNPTPAAGTPAPAAQAQAQGEDVLQKVARTKQLNVAVVVYPPLTIHKDGVFSGTFIEAAKWLGAQMEATVNYVSAEFGTFIAAIQSGRADIALSGSFATVPRAMAVDFTESVMWFGSSALVRRADVNKWATIEDADQPGVRFVQAEGTAIHRQLTQLVKNGSVIALAPGTPPSNLALEVLSNRADIYVEDDWLVRNVVEQQQQLVMMPAYVDKPWGLNAVSWAVAKGQTGMLNVLNVAIDRLTENNKFQEWDKQFGAHWLYRKETFYQGDSA